MLDWACHTLGILSALTAVLFGVLFHQLVWRYWSFFSDRRVPFVRGVPILGTNHNVLLGKEPLLTAMSRLYNTFPEEPIIGMYDIGGVPQYIVRDPELIKTLNVKQFDHFMNHRIDVDAAVDPLAARNLFFSKGQAWREMRTTLSPAFTGSKMRAMFALVVKCGEQFVQHLRTNPAADGVYEMKETFSRYANDTIASCAFGLEVDSMAQRDNDFFRTGVSLTAATTAFLLKFLGYSTMPRVMSFFKVRLVRPEDEEYFRSIVRQTIEYRQKNKVVRNDMIDLLMQARESILAERVDEDGSKGSSEKMTDLTETDFVAQCMIFFIAGFDTSSALMSFMSHELAINPDIQSRLYDECVEVHRSLNGQALTYDHLNKLVYMDMVVSESLRKWPPVGAIDRINNRPVTIDVAGRPLHFDVGDGFVVPAIGLHHDPKYWTNPEEFDPERFNETNIGQIVSGTYVPFGMGPRICIGQRFALMETKSLFYHLLLEFRLERCAQTQHPLRLGEGVTATAEKGFWLRFSKR